MSNFFSFLEDRERMQFEAKLASLEAMLLQECAKPEAYDSVKLSELSVLTESLFGMPVMNIYGDEDKTYGEFKADILAFLEHRKNERQVPIEG